MTRDPKRKNDWRERGGPTRIGGRGWIVDPVRLQPQSPINGSSRVRGWRESKTSVAQAIEPATTACLSMDLSAVQAPGWPI
jgi:hypothetical protein